MIELWAEKYRPRTVNDGYVFRDPQQKSQILSWVEQKSIPHLLFSGAAGIGKTTLAKILFNELDINEFDILEINASRTNSVDDVRDKIINFSQMIPFGDFKVILLDEADYLSPAAQAALRGVMEEYHTNARFILTCNYPNKIIPALHSRCQGFHFEKIDLVEFTARMATILINEEVTFDLDVLDTFVKATYPDLRKCINLVQMNSQQKVLQSPSTSDSGDSDYKFEMVKLFKQGKFGDARKLICSQVRQEEVIDLFTWLYNHVDLFGDTEYIQENAILIIKQGMVDHTFVADPEVNLSATLIRLKHLCEQ